MAAYFLHAFGFGAIFDQFYKVVFDRSISYAACTSHHELCLAPLNFEPTGNIYACDHKRVTCACDCIRHKIRGTHHEQRNEYIIESSDPDHKRRKSFCLSVRCIVLVKLLASYLHKLRSKETPSTQFGRIEWNFNVSVRVFRKPRCQFYYVLFIIFWQLKSAKVCHPVHGMCVCILCTHARYVRSRNDFVTFRTIGINYIKMGFTVSCVSTWARPRAFYLLLCMFWFCHLRNPFKVLAYLVVEMNCRKTYWPNPDAYSNYIIHHEISMA